MTERASNSGRLALVLSCEHASPRIPSAHLHLFEGAEAVLQSHRAHDPGAIEVARAIARRFGVAVHAGRWSRLLVDLNRSPSNPAVFSAWSQRLPAPKREALLNEIHATHHRAVADAVRAAARRHPVVHVSVHSFAPVLRGKVRTADVGLLYDPGRTLEREIVARWKGLLERWPDLRVRRNYPYRGVSDGLTRCLRREFSDRRYAGIELELNHGWMETGEQWARLRSAIVGSLAALLEGTGVTRGETRRRAR